MTRSVSDVFIETLVAAGVRRVYGVVGDSLNGLTDVIRKNKDIDWLHVRHEEVAAFAAGADAHVSGQLAVCAGSCGPGNLHLINGLYDCHRSRVPVLAIAAQIPSAELGSALLPGDAPRAPLQGLQPLLRTGLAGRTDAPRAWHRHANGYCQTGRGGRDPARRRGLAKIRISSPVSWNRPPGINHRPPGGRPQEGGRDPERGTEGGDSWRCGLRGRPRRAHRSRRSPEGPDRSRDARQGIHRARQPLRRRHDGAAGLFVGLSRDDGLRCPLDARHRLPVSAVLSEGRESRAG